ncbi:MAG: hypothetical protein ACFFCS_15005 [Candidatus Hodarchaeota archaeon]
MSNSLETFKQNCMICKSPLIYSEESTKKQCRLCKNEFFAATECENGHYVCDHCHSMDAFEVIKMLVARPNLMILSPLWN